MLTVNGNTYVFYTGYITTGKKDINQIVISRIAKRANKRTSILTSQYPSYILTKYSCSHIISIYQILLDGRDWVIETTLSYCMWKSNQKFKIKQNLNN